MVVAAQTDRGQLELPCDFAFAANCSPHMKTQMTTGDKSVDCDTCSACSLRECPEQPAAIEGPLTGWTFALASVVLFITPVLLATIGAMLGGANHTSQFLGATGGFIVGMGGAVLCTKLVSKSDKDNV